MSLCRTGWILTSMTRSWRGCAGSISGRGWNMNEQNRGEKMNLYQINEEIMECVDTETGEIIDCERLDALQMERDVKIENIALWIKNLRSDVEALKAEEQALAGRRKAAENKAESLKKCLTRYLAGQKFSTAKVAVSFRRTSSVNITDLSVLPGQYLRYKDPEPDKTAIKNAVKAGETVAGAEIVSGQSISIK